MWPNDFESYQKIGKIGKIYKVSVCLSDGVTHEAVRRVIPFDVSISKETLMNSAKNFSELEHTGILKLYQYGILEGNNEISKKHTFWFIQEFTGCEEFYLDNLLDIMDSGMSETLIAAILKQILQLLDYMHKSGTVWYDVRCRNIGFRNSGSVVVNLFSLRSAVQLKTRDSLPYIAPENFNPVTSSDNQQNQDISYRSKSDIWSLGITALHMVTGQVPISGTLTVPQICEIIKKKQLPIPSNISDEFKYVLNRCLDSDPNRRASAQDLLECSFFQNSLGDQFIKQSLSKYFQKLAVKSSHGRFINKSPSTDSLTFGNEFIPQQQQNVNHLSIKSSQPSQQNNQQQPQQPQHHNTATASSIHQSLGTSQGFTRPRSHSQVDKGQSTNETSSATDHQSFIHSHGGSSGAGPGPGGTHTEGANNSVRTDHSTSSTSTQFPTTSSTPTVVAGQMAPPTTKPRISTLKLKDSSSSIGQGSNNNLLLSATIPPITPRGQDSNSLTSHSQGGSSSHSHNRTDSNGAGTNQNNTTQSSNNNEDTDRVSDIKKLSRLTKPIRITGYPPAGNLPLETYVGETKTHLIVIIRAIPSTSISLQLESECLVIRGNLPTLKVMEGVTLMDSPVTSFERRIEFPYAVNHSKVTKEKKSSTLIVRIQKFSPIDLGSEIL
eukprot:TRINITY_DN2225_c2_g1_i1.p1 TRINITY_DN2225_c2_g1~~TRINITY_DN2225_c2_g1_i1.p1  ORF type:complete len:663 (-),score=96.37 TRINITY_DN2225_c2_g1_i1:190-2178(-)